VQVSPSLEPRALTLSVGVLLIGNACLLASLVTSVVMAQALLRRGVGLWLALVSSLVLVAGFDTVLFQLLAGHQELSWAGLRANLVGKSVMALLLGSLAAWFLRDVHRAHDDGPAALDLLAVMSFRRRLEALERELQTDVLTGLYNRRYLEREVPALLRLDRNRGRSTALVLVDLDHFKLINDRHGHLVGDQALAHVARLLQQGVREDMDSVIRYGGEEFVLVVPGTSAAEAGQRTEELLQSLRDQPLKLADGRLLPITATAGVAASPQDGEGWWELLQRADERLYAGKRAGRDRVVLESPP
jgi:diguanylate cyclase (GGDEF)-like protein